jgi:hypothetical protein
LTIPLKKDINEAIKVIPKATAKLRTGFGELYATYMFSIGVIAILPYFIS